MLFTVYQVVAIELLKTLPCERAMQKINIFLGGFCFNEDDKDVAEALVYTTVISTIEWIYNELHSPLPDDERETRIDEIILLCFFLDHSKFTKCEPLFKRYAAPFFVEPGYTKAK